MDSSKFKEILFHAAFFAMSCDGEIHEEEIKEIRSISGSIPLLKGFDIEKELNVCVAKMAKDPKQAVKKFLRELNSYQFSPQEKQQILSISIITIDADDKVVDDELFLLDQLLTALALPTEVFSERYPKHYKMLEDFRDSGKLKEFSNNMKNLDFSGLVNNNPFLLM